jgi:hypothetical protein
VFAFLISRTAEPRPANRAPLEGKRQQKTTVLGTVFEVDPRFQQPLNDNLARIRKDLRSQRAQGKLIAYISTPISPRGGGHEPTNLAIAASVKARLEAHYGSKLWALDPGQYQIAKIEGPQPQGGDFMFMWTQVLAGEDGSGSDFDMVYFVGPSDVAAYFGAGDRDTLSAIDRYIEAKATESEAFKKEVASDAKRREAFLRFYGLRASVNYSKGAHDEWNIFVKINDRRGVGEQIPMYYDGRALSPAEMEMEVAPGYEVR